MKISLVSVSVADQKAALAFYTEKLGFIKKQDIPIGDASWLTVVSPEDVDGPELVLAECRIPCDEGTETIADQRRYTVYRI